MYAQHLKHIQLYEYVNIIYTVNVYLYMLILFYLVITKI